MTDTTIKPLAVRRKGAAKMISEGTTKVDELVAKGLLDGRKSGKNLLILVNSIERYLESLPKADLKLPKHLIAPRPASAPAPALHERKRLRKRREATRD